MYRQEKRYVILAKDGRKICDAGLLKIGLTDEKIRVEYFLNDLPMHYGIQMECVIKYRQQGEVVSTKCWKDTLKKTNSRYVFSLKITKPIEELMDCCLIFPGSVMVVSDEKATIAEVASAGLKPEESRDKADIKDNKSSNTEKEEPQIQYIRDLDYLKYGNKQMQELYYNSFLLHGFYQHRYLILGKDFIGVPDHFYEREAVAAKMMGFPYFMEAEYVETCSLEGDMRKEAPQMGCFGYYLMKLNPDRGAQHSE
nr:hypothetical protein [Lachnospiraceae bacterium]